MLTIGGMLLIGFLPPTQRVLGRAASRLRNVISPPEAVVFVPQSQALSSTVIATTAPLSATPTLVATSTTAATVDAPTPQPAGESVMPTPMPSVTPQPTATSIPSGQQIEGIEYQDQHGLWNYCGPSNLAMLVSFWGEPTDRTEAGAFMRGGLERVDDKNVSPDEMVTYVETQTELEAVYRVGGSLELLKGLISAEFPVIVEIGYTPDSPSDWMGHYLLLNGYDDSTRQFTSQDSYKGSDELYGYDALDEAWRAFNDSFIVAYTPERQPELMTLLDTVQDEQAAAAIALETARSEAQLLSGQQQYFAQLNMVDSLVALARFDEAAATLDASFTAYANLPPSERPWRTLWYRFEPFEAYFMAGRYQDVVSLADTTLANMDEPILEELYYWRARAYFEQGQPDLAIRDMQTTIALNTSFKNASTLLTTWQNK